MTDRPLALTALSVFTAVVGLASVLVGIAGSSLLALVVGPLQLVAAYGLWTLQPWGGLLGGVVYVFDGLRKGGDVLAGEPLAMGGLAVNAAIVAYLYANREVFAVS